MLQIEQVFTNVTKGQVAKKEDWVKSFATDDMSRVIEEVSARALPIAHTFRFCARAICKSTTWNAHITYHLCLGKSLHWSRK